MSNLAAFEERMAARRAKEKAAEIPVETAEEKEEKRQKELSTAYLKRSHRKEMKPEHHSGKGTKTIA